MHLLHDVASVDLYCCLAGSDFGGNVLVENAGDHEGHNLPLSRSQCVIALVQIVDLGLLFSCRSVTLKCLLNGVQKILVPKRLRQKLHGARLQRSDRHRNVSMRSDKDDGDLHADLGQLALEIEPTHLRQSYIQNQATRVRAALLSQKLLTSFKRRGTKTN